MPVKKTALKGQVVVISGTMSQPRAKVEALIKTAGGESGSSVTAKTTVLVTTDAEFQSITTKVAQAKGRSLPIVAESWLDACVKKGAVVDTTPHLLGGAAKGTKRKAASAGPPAKAAKAGKASSVPVNPKSGLVGKVKVYGTFNTELLQQEPSTNTDKYYKIQVLQSNKGSEFWALQHWGRTGTSGQSKLDGPYDDASDAAKIFTQKFKEKTGQLWGQYTKQQAGKYAMLNVIEGDRGPMGRWQYYLHNSVDGKKVGWYDYDKGAMKEMEDLWHTFQANLWLGTRYVESGKWTYAVDLPNMQQTNTSTSTTRGIRRVPHGTTPSKAAPVGY